MPIFHIFLVYIRASIFNFPVINHLLYSYFSFSRSNFLIDFTHLEATGKREFEKIEKSAITDVEKLLGGRVKTSSSEKFSFKLNKTY